MESLRVFFEVELGNLFWIEKKEKMVYSFGNEIICDFVFFRFEKYGVWGFCGFFGSLCFLSFSF